MSINVSAAISSLPSPMNFARSSYTMNFVRSSYTRCMDFTRKYVPALLIDLVETTTPWVGSIAACYAVFVSLPLALARHLFKEQVEFSAGREFFVAISGTFIGIQSLLKYNEYIKLPYIQNRMKKIIDSSQSAPKSLLAFSKVGNPLSILDMAMVLHSQTDLFEKLAKTHSIEILDGTSESIKTKMGENQKKYDLIFIHSHGTEEKVKICPGFEISMTSRKMLRWFNDHIKDGGAIVLGSCLSGYGEENIGRRFSTFCPKAVIYASSAAVHKAIGVEFDERAIPSFNDGIFVKKGQDTTRIYQNGVLVSKSSQSKSQ